jgi:outer membrane protein assembly factor BamB
MKRTLCATLAALALVATSGAQFTGPAPLAWRWYQPTSVAPSGSPVASGDTIYFGSGNRVYSIDRSTGNMKWRFPAVEPINGAFRSAPVLKDGVLVAVADNKTVYGIDPNGGSLKWTFDLPGRAIGQPLAAGKYVIVTQADNNILAIDPATGQAGWESPLKINDGLYGSIGVNGDDILVFNSLYELFSISTISKKTTWRTKLSQISTSVAPVTVGGTIYVNSGPYLIALNAITGRARWQSDSRLSELAYAPAVSPSMVFVVSRDGQALGFDLNGRQVNRDPIQVGSTPIAQPTTVGDKYFIVPTANGAINLVDPTYVAPPKPGDADKPKVDPRDVVIPVSRIDAPSPDLIWSFVIAPVSTSTSEATTSRGPGGFPGGPGGFPGGPGGFPGGGNQQQNTSTPVTSVQVAAPVVLVGQTLLVPAKDGSLLAFDNALGVDLTSPRVDMIWPGSGDQVSGKPPLELYFKIEDEATGVDVKTLTISIDGKPFEYTYTRDGFANVRFSTIGANKPLQDGRKNIVVKVSDWIGNTTEKTFSLLIDNSLPPIVRPGSQQDQPGRRPGGPGGAGGKGGGIGGLG